MSFSVYSSTSNKLLVQIQDNTVEFISPAISNQLKKINVESCFPIYMEGEAEEIFGTVKEIMENDPNYPLALRMFCEAQLLTHPETYRK